MKTILTLLYLSGFFFSGILAILSGFSEEYLEGIYHMLWLGFFTYQLEKDLDDG
jgi:hypothetical protein